eukprot:RCo015055
MQRRAPPHRPFRTAVARQGFPRPPRGVLGRTRLALRMSFPWTPLRGRRRRPLQRSIPTSPVSLRGGWLLGRHFKPFEKAGRMHFRPLPWFPRPPRGAVALLRFPLRMTPLWARALQMRFPTSPVPLLGGWLLGRHFKPFETAGRLHCRPSPCLPHSPRGAVALLRFAQTWPTSSLLLLGGCLLARLCRPCEAAYGRQARQGSRPHSSHRPPFCTRGGCLQPLGEHKDQRSGTQRRFADTSLHAGGGRAASTPTDPSIALCSKQAPGISPLWAEGCLSRRRGNVLLLPDFCWPGLRYCCCAASSHLSKRPFLEVFFSCR